jgi:hypothetical protein
VRVVRRCQHHALCGRRTKFSGPPTPLASLPPPPHSSTRHPQLLSRLSLTPTHTRLHFRLPPLPPFIPNRRASRGQWSGWWVGWHCSSSAPYKRPQPGSTRTNPPQGSCQCGPWACWPCVNTRRRKAREGGREEEVEGNVVTAVAAALAMRGDREGSMLRCPHSSRQLVV